MLMSKTRHHVEMFDKQTNHNFEVVVGNTLNIEDIKKFVEIFTASEIMNTRDKQNVISFEERRRRT